MPSKHQLKKEKKAARKNRKHKKHEGRNHGDGATCNKTNDGVENNNVAESGKMLCLWNNILSYSIKIFTFYKFR